MGYELFEELKKTQNPDSFTFSILIKGLKNQARPDIDLGIKLFNEYQKTNEHKEIILFNSVLDLLICTGNIQKADNIFKKIEVDSELSPDEITFNTIIKGCCKNKDFETAMRYFNKMKDFHLKPNRITYNSMMDLAVKVKKMAEALHLIE